MEEKLDWFKNRGDILRAGLILLTSYIRITVFGDNQNELLLIGAIKIKINETINKLAIATSSGEHNLELVTLASQLVKLIPSGCSPINMPLNKTIGVCSLNPIFDDLSLLRIKAMEYLTTLGMQMEYDENDHSLTQKSQNIVEAIDCLLKRSKLIKESQATELN